MPPPPRNQRYVCTLLDRFFMDEARGLTRSVQDEFSLQEYLQSIQSDLKDLLNTRQTMVEADLEGHEEAQQSILVYGFPELNAVTFINSGTQKMLASAMENAIRQFEPRLTAVRVTTRKSEAGELKFHVEALARMEPRPHKVAFDTTLDLDKQECSIESIF